MDRWPLTILLSVRERRRMLGWQVVHSCGDWDCLCRCYYQPGLRGCFERGIVNNPDLMTRQRRADTGSTGRVSHEQAELISGFQVMTWQYDTSWAFEIETQVSPDLTVYRTQSEVAELAWWAVMLESEGDKADAWPSKVRYTATRKAMLPTARLQSRSTPKLATPAVDACTWGPSR